MAEVSKARRIGKGHAGKPIHADTIRRIEELLANGETHKLIASRMDVSESTVGTIARRMKPSKNEPKTVWPEHYWTIKRELQSGSFGSD